MKINGKWYFNETLPVETEGANQEVKFVSNRKEYDGIRRYYGTKYGYTVEYNLPEDSPAVFRIDGDDVWWVNEAYRTIDFGAAYQEVSDEFYSWLTANAVQLSKPIPMTHPKGIKLLTKGKKCTEDIEVVPTFIETVEIKISDMAGIFTDDEATTFMLMSVVENGVVNVRKVAAGETVQAVKNSFALDVGAVSRDHGYYGPNGVTSFDENAQTYGYDIVYKLDRDGLITSDV